MMSRLIIKNLPKTINETKIREIFGIHGNITDVQLKYTSDGKFRQFGFIGFHNENEANSAIKELNNTHLGTNKISVEHCAILGGDKKPKSWSKYAADSNAYKKKHAELFEREIKHLQPIEKNKHKEQVVPEKYKDDPAFQEFLHLHVPKDSKLLLHSKVDGPDEEEEKSDDDSKLANKRISDSEYMQSLMKKKHFSENAKEETLMGKKLKHKLDLFTVKLRNLPYNCKKRDIKDFFRPLVPFSIRIPRNIKGIAYAGFKTEKNLNRAILKDKSFIVGKRISVLKYLQINESNKNQTVDFTKTKWKTQEDGLEHEESIAESGRIFIRNLSYGTCEDDIQKLFLKYGPITEVSLPVDSTTRKFKGFGIVTFLIPEHAVKAYLELDGSIVHGRMLHLLPGKAKDEPKHEELETTNFKRKKASKEKSAATSSHNWNSLFLGHNAVADVVAQTYGTTKETVLNPYGEGSAAVRLALGETQIVTSTRKYLEKEGVMLDAFNQVTWKRSKNIILVKNLPADTKLVDVRALFDKFGVINRIIFPPSGITAIVEFFEPSEARKAFMNLAYSKFKHLPLYLEWAPANSLIPGKSVAETKENQQINDEEHKEVTETNEIIEAETEEEEPEDNATLFVKNLNFQTNDERLHQHFSVCGKVYYATVATKKDKNDAKNKLSMGYGFVRFYLRTSADKALKTLQCSTLDGKTLELKRSERTLQDNNKTTKKHVKNVKQTGTKILVRNVPFQANQKEILELFRTFGEIKALRLPKKMSGGEGVHRGFAFIDYSTPSDAKKAFEALCQSTHLYGRRLVLEWATTEEGVEEIRKRTAQHFHVDTEIRSKKSILDVENN